MRFIKGRSARLLNQQQGCKGRIWQPGFHDHALRHDEDRLKVARYIIANPLRAGLVNSIGAYPHWDCEWL
jgi:REP element-mobilizing transposase RayT